MDRLSIKEIDFEQVLPIWENFLWPNRTSKTSPMSSMCYLGGNDMDIYKKYKPRFCGLYIDKELVGVNSCHQTSDTQMRLRGIFLFEKWRNRGLGAHLFKFVDDSAALANCAEIWSFPRLERRRSYEKAGYKMVSDPVHTGEFGPNLYALKELS
jgi:GNAT superfamily N-acetyltransferase